MKRAHPIIVVLAMWIGALPSASAEWGGVSDSNWSVYGGIGLSAFSANEFVYSGNNTISQLIWETTGTPTASLGVDAALGGGWRLSLKGEAGLSGDGHMRDYDWLAPFATGFGPGDWSHFSDHPDTHLQHYVSLGGDVSHDLQNDGVSRFSVAAGLRYTDIQWTAYGGSFIYSTAALRDTVGVFPAGSAGVTYRQQLPLLLAGVDFARVSDDWHLDLKLRGGAAIGSLATDDHWWRSLRFEDRIWFAPALAADARVSRALWDSGEVYLTASALKIFEGKGDTRVTNTGTNAVTIFSNAGGLDYLSLTVSAGLLGQF